MDIEALTTFLAIHREGGISSAARRLHRSQPAISRRIALLEAELGVPLFERIGGRLALSQAGSALLPFAERAVAAVHDAAHAMAALAAGNAGPVALAVVGTIAGAQFSECLRRFAADRPGADLQLRMATSLEVSELVRRGEFHVGLRYETDRADDLRCETLAREPLSVVCSPAHPLAGRRVARLAALRDERWLAFPEIPQRREIAASHVFAIFRAHGLGDVSWTAVDSLTAQKRLVEAGLGLALIAESGAAEELAAGTLAAISVGGLDARQPIVAVTRRGGYLSPAALRLLEILRDGYAAGTASPLSPRRRAPALQPRGRAARPAARR